ncbi:zinc dependent phospholipase C family protein [Papillibacter cinnamivorans]|uniref:Zinc dependent phospholipase C n=1 Tax=Papillibacter cinnamivorans DSM 12816 TaxID=1122930 RepID=A0A1W1ZFP3_9FIRM|nr:zinc dependent phospholipase C family protein [Papillibacter cinnamivorans]SMC47166.1 hypothetical protein SAMN02745168_1031 [Papillibacter cinnamivorans DSM 12816]
MPACAAHYQFGQDVLHRLDEHWKSCALAHKREYDIGLQGPDPFFYYKPYRRNEVVRYGEERHGLPACRMFVPILEKVHEGAALSYMMGLICHYSLDKTCHPYVFAHCKTIDQHEQMESAFDRQILSARGWTEPRYLCLNPDGLDYPAMASLWPGMDGETLRKCVKSQRRLIRLLDYKRVLKVCQTVINKPGRFTAMSLPSCVPGNQAEHVRHLDALYRKALEECPELIRAACESMGKKPVSCRGFEQNYKGEPAPGQDGAATVTP